MGDVKKPQDRQGKKPRVKEVEGGTEVTFPDIPLRGRDGKVILSDEKPVPLRVTVPTDALDDFELLDEMRAIDVEQKASMMPAVLRRLIGDDFRQVMDALRAPETGRVSITDASQWIRDLMAAINPS